MKRKPGRKPAVRAPNPYHPALLALADRWTPEQLAETISKIDRAYAKGYDISRDLILELSKLPSRPTSPGGFSAPPSDSPLADALGRCQRCNRVDAEFATTLLDGQSMRVCGECYSAMEAEDEERYAREAARKPPPAAEGTGEDAEEEGPTGGE